MFGLKPLQNLNAYILWISVMLFMQAIYLNQTFTENRNKNYKKISYSKVIISFCTIIITVLTGLVSDSVNGLILGVIFGSFCGCIFLIERKSKIKFANLFTKKSKMIFRKYKDFPLLNSSSSSLNALAIHLPFIIFLNSYGPIKAGLFALTIRVLNAPLIFISTSISQVLIAKVAELIRNNHSVVSFVLKIMMALVGISILPFIIITNFGEELFELIFGPSWRKAGSYAEILILAILIRFVVSTISCTLNSANRSDLLAIWKTFSLITSFVTLTIASQYLDAIGFIYTIVFLDIVIYLIYLFTIIIGIKSPKVQCQRII